MTCPRAVSLMAAVYDRAVKRRHRAASEALVRTSALRGRTAPASTAFAPASGHDVLSDVLRTVRLTGALFFVFEASSPWGENVPDGAALAPIILPRAQHVISYHVITRGACWGSLAGGVPVRLRAGDVLVLPHGDAYAMWLGAERWTRGDSDDLAFFRQMAAGGLPFTLRGGGGGEPLHLVCGFLGCDLRP